MVFVVTGGEQGMGGMSEEDGAIEMVQQSGSRHSVQGGEVASGERGLPVGVDDPGFSDVREGM